MLGKYDFVNILTATDNESAARFSMESGVVAGFQKTTMAAISVARFKDLLNQEQTWRKQRDPNTLISTTT